MWDRFCRVPGAIADGSDEGVRVHRLRVPLTPRFNIAPTQEAPVVRLADARPMHLGHCIEADARFRLFVFAPAGDTGAPGGPVAALGDGKLGIAGLFATVGGAPRQFLARVARGARWGGGPPRGA